jgi:predicted DNA-binding transcriptional regulator YafY
MASIHQESTVTQGGRTMRADRLISILLHLQSHQKLTAAELAQRLEVSVRTIYRDMEALGMAGVPVVAERGNGGGWSLLEGYRTDLTGLKPAEVQALFLANPAHLLADLGLGQASEAALVKLLAALPSLQRRDAEHVRQRIHVDAAGWRRPDEDLSALPVLQDAVWQEYKVDLTYRRNDGTKVERRVDPLGLVAKGSVWYLVAGVEGSLRTYRVSRVQAVQTTDQPCARPPDFDLAGYWAQSSADFVANLPQYPARLRVDPAIVSRLPHGGWFARLETVGPPQADGWHEVAICFETPDEACGYVLGFGPQIEVLDPAELRARVVEMAKGIVARYPARAAP